MVQSWFSQNRRPARRIRTYTYCAHQIVSHEIELQHYAAWQKRRLTDSRYNRLPKEPHQFLHKYGIITCLLSQQPPTYRWCKSWDVGNILVVWVYNLPMEQYEHHSAIVTITKEAWKFCVHFFCCHIWFFIGYLTYFLAITVQCHFCLDPAPNLFMPSTVHFSCFGGWVFNVSELVYMCIFYPHRRKKVLDAVYRMNR
jgi:hypothetical protein